MNGLKRLKEKLNQFNKERDWDQFHAPKNIAIALSVEASEIVEIFQWMDTEESYELEDEKLKKLKEEIGDVFLYLLLLAMKYDIELLEAANEKLIKNGEKYPIQKAKGSSRKYNEF